MSASVFQLDGEFEVLPDLGCIRRLGGAEIPLRPKTFQTLLFLIQNRHRLVSKEELTAHLWADTAVTDDALVQCIVELRKALGDAAREPRFVRTVPKLGYRFIGHVVEVASPNAAAPVVREDIRPTDVSEPTAWQPWSWWAASVAMTLVTVTAVVLLMNAGTTTETASLDTTSGKPGIAVMFLDNQTRTGDIDWMRQGLAEMLITGLSRSDRVNVLGRKHLQTLLDRLNHPVDQEISLDTAREVARRAHAQFLLMGSFARMGDKTRIDVRIEGLDAKQLASETLTVDRPEDVLTQVDLLAWKLATNFDATVQKPAGMAASGLTTDLDAYRAYSLGLSKAIAYHNEEAVKLFERALELDPNFVMARARLGYVYGVTWGLIDQAAPHLEAAFRQVDRLRESDRLYIEAWYALARLDFPAAVAPLQRIVRLYPHELEAHNWLARVLMGERRLADATEVTRRALVIDPESTDLHNTLGSTYISTGRFADAIAAYRRYVGLAPNEPNSYDSLGLAFQAAGRYEEAESAFSRALELKPDFEVALVHLANVHFQTGRYRSAEKLYERYVAIAKSPLELARGHASLMIIRLRHGRFAGAAESERAATAATMRITPVQPRWAAMAFGALTGRPAAQLPKPAGLTPLGNRGSRASRRWHLWMFGQDALARGNSAGALEFLRHSLQENPIVWDLDPLDDGLALAYHQLGRWDDAIAELERVVRANPRYPRAHYFLGVAYEEKGELGAARAALQQFLTVWSGADDDIPEVIDARKRLARLQS